MLGLGEPPVPHRQGCPGDVRVGARAVDPDNAGEGHINLALLEVHRHPGIALDELLRVAVGIVHAEHDAGPGRSARR